MEKFVKTISSLPSWFLVYLPTICGTILYPETKPILSIEFIFLVITIWHYDPWKKSDLSEASGAYLCQLIFLGLLFLEVIMTNIDSNVVNENASYYLPGFMIDFLSPNNTALKLTSISTIFLIYLMFYRKSKEY